MGVTIAAMNSEISSQFNIDENLGKVVIIEVEENGPAFTKDYHSGLRSEKRAIKGFDSTLFA